jgi:endonuclease YncB( thermonuclease family)
MMQWSHSLWVGIVVLVLNGPAQAIDATRQFQITDGDSIVIAGERIRLHGIDAPEARQSCLRATGTPWPCGTWATAQLREITSGAQLNCQRLDTDRFGRTIARCQANGRDVGAEMVARGAAVAFVRYSAEYLAQEQAAKAAQQGLWAGRFERPEDWRRATRTAEVQEIADTSCAIKGNISGNGRIYHLPGQNDYDRTVIRESQGERWFCSEQDAQQAGWRRARR